MGAVLLTDTFISKDTVFRQNVEMIVNAVKTAFRTRMIINMQSLL